MIEDVRTLENTCHTECFWSGVSRRGDIPSVRTFTFEGLCDGICDW